MTLVDDENEDDYRTTMMSSLNLRFSPDILSLKVKTLEDHILDILELVYNDNLSNSWTKYVLNMVGINLLRYIYN